MIKLDTAQFAPDIATALLLRGAELPSLQWHDNPLRAAKTNLGNKGVRLTFSDS